MYASLSGPSQSIVNGMTPIGNFMAISGIISVGLVISWGRKMSLQRSNFISEKSFPELKAYSKSTQCLAFLKADEKAFPGWRWVVPALLSWSLIAISIVGAPALIRSGFLSHTPFKGIWFPILIVALALRLLRRFELLRVRPCLLSDLQLASSERRAV